MQPCLFYIEKCPLTQKRTSQIFISAAFCWNYSNNSVQQNTQEDNMSWFMNKTTNPDTTVNRYGMTYELQNYCLFCCMMPQLCDSHWLCMPPIWASILYLKPLVFSPPQNCETSELKMGLRHTITHHPQTVSPPADILQHSSLTLANKNMVEQRRKARKLSFMARICVCRCMVRCRVFHVLHNRAWIEALIEKVRVRTRIGSCSAQGSMIKCVNMSGENNKEILAVQNHYYIRVPLQLHINIW